MKRKRVRPPKNMQDGSLTVALTQLEDAVAALTQPQPHTHNQRIVWLDSRYDQLRGAITTPAVSGHRRNTPSSLIPAQIDALKLTIHIDQRTAVIIDCIECKRGIHFPHQANCSQYAIDTPTRLQQILRRRYRPMDSKRLTEISTELVGFTQAIDDLFATKPIYLPDPCPQCRHGFAYKLNDCGERVRTPALAVTAERGAVCQQCHATWLPERLLWLGRVLGYRQPEGITA